mmetsp:Transcript_11579/g.31565  ORF Transcript_11579/g.31565 Transcript_11579/m.31565 type:complete len:275 (+) Transcript_11579:361-1185(+)
MGTVGMGTCLVLELPAAAEGLHRPQRVLAPHAQERLHRRHLAARARLHEPEPDSGGAGAAGHAEHAVLGERGCALEHNVRAEAQHAQAEAARLLNRCQGGLRHEQQREAVGEARGALREGLVDAAHADVAQQPQAGRLEALREPGGRGVPAVQPLGGVAPDVQGNPPCSGAGGGDGELLHARCTEHNVPFAGHGGLDERHGRQLALRHEAVALAALLRGADDDKLAVVLQALGLQQRGGDGDALAALDGVDNQPRYAQPLPALPQQPHQGRRPS